MPPHDSRDATDQRRIDRELLRLRLGIERSGEIVFLTDPEGRITYVNPTFERVYGYRADEALGQTPRILKSGLMSQDEYREFWQVLLAKRTISGEIVNRTKDGRLVTVEASANPVVDADGTLVGFLAIQRDVTARRESDAQLRLSDSILASVGNLVIVADATGAIQYVSPSVRNLLGYEPADLLGDGWWLRTGGDPEERARERARVAAMAGGDLPVPAGSYERQVTNRTGGVRWMAWTDARGPDGLLIGVGLDITERRHAEEALRESEAQFRALIAHTVHGIFRTAPDGRFLLANPALVELLGYATEDEVLALDLARDVCAEGGRTLEVLQRAGEEPIRGAEVTWNRRGAGQFTARLSGRAIRDPDGGVRHFEVLVEDVTARRNLEIQLQHSQRLDAIGQLTAGIAHDFNNILTSIVANAELVTANLPPESVGLRADLRDITAVATRGAEMIKKLMAFSRREHLALEALDVEQLIREMAGVFRRVLPESIAVAVGVRDVGTARLNRSAIEQVLLNLATNARDAMPEGGTLRIEAEPTTLTGSLAGVNTPIAPGQYVRVTVSDTGVGMEERVAARIFEPFFTTKPPGKGTGLGLAMVYGLVKQQGGYITVSSTPRRGTRFQLYFPTTFPAGLQAEAEPAADLVGGTENILLVEDDEAIRRLAKRLLERFGYHVVVAVDGQDAAEFLREHGGDIDLVISDVVMPRMSGPELLDIARSGGNRVRFIFTSGYAMEQTRLQTPVLARHPFLHKPWTVAELLTTIRTVLDAPALE